MTPSVPRAVTADTSALQDEFARTVVSGSSRYWAAHFSHADIRDAVMATLCFAHQMDELAVASPDVIHQKSVWWHDELQRFTAHESRHPVTQALQALGLHGLADSLHQHLHGALTTQQQIEIKSQEDWHQYADLRVGSLHHMFGQIAGMEPDQTERFAQWAGRITLHAVTRVPQLYAGGHWSVPGNLNAPTAAAKSEFTALLEQRPGPGSVASEVLLQHERRWWQSAGTESSPFYSNKPLGVRDLFASWRTARSTPYP